MSKSKNSLNFICLALSIFIFTIAFLLAYFTPLKNDILFDKTSMRINIETKSLLRNTLKHEEYNMAKYNRAECFWEQGHGVLKILPIESIDYSEQLSNSYSHNSEYLENHKNTINSFLSSSSQSLKISLSLTDPGSIEIRLIFLISIIFLLGLISGLFVYRPAGKTIVNLFR